MTKLNRAKFLQTLQTLLGTTAIETQEELCQALAQCGIVVNQAMVSRALHKLGAVKINEGNKLIYRLPTEFTAVTPKNALTQLIFSIASNENLIVITTAPGSAQLVAKLLDQQKPTGILGTVAGDDTVFIAPQTIKEITTLKQQITAILML